MGRAARRRAQRWRRYHARRAPAGASDAPEQRRASSEAEAGDETGGGGPVTARIAGLFKELKSELLEAAALLEALEAKQRRNGESESGAGGEGSGQSAAQEAAGEAASGSSKPGNASATPAAGSVASSALAPR